MLIAHSISAANSFLRLPRDQAQKHSNDNDQPGGSRPVSLADPLTSDRDALMCLERTASP